MLIEVAGLVAGHNGTPVVWDLDLSVREGEVVALLGANGAGKTTTLMTIAGVLPAIRGEVRVAGRAIHGLQSFRVARLGLSTVPQNRGLFHQLTVRENLRLATRKGASTSMKDVFDYFPAVEPLLRRRCGLLSGGEQQMVALAKGVLSEPTILLIDEMSLGLAPIIVSALLDTVRNLATERRMGVLLVEQQVGLALAVADRGYVLSRGRLALTGPADELASRRDVLHSSYMGEAAL